MRYPVSPRFIITLLILITSIVGVTSVFGGISLIVTDGLGIPKAWLATSPFTNFFWPGMILTFIVGGTNCLAVYSLIKNFNIKYEALAVAGFGLQIWIYTELYMIKQPHLLQIIYFALGTAILTLTFLLFRLKSQKT